MPRKSLSAVVFVIAAVFAWPGSGLLRAAPPQEEDSTVLAVGDRQFTIDGEPAFLLGISYYGALGAPEAFIRQDLDDLQAAGFNWIRAWATWGAFGSDVSAVDSRGEARAPFLGKLQWLVAECDRRGMIVDVTLTRGKPSSGSLAGGALPDAGSHRRAVETIVRSLGQHRNWYLDLANERDVGDDRFVPVGELAQLRELVRQLDPRRLVTASFGGHDLSPRDVRDSLLEAGHDFLAVHRPRDSESPQQTEARTRELLAITAGLGRPVPVHHQEPFRRGYGGWEPEADDFLADLRGALAGGAAGWCLHNGSQRNATGNQPRRSFDLRERRLVDQLDAVERVVLARAGAVVAGTMPAAAGDRLRVMVETDAGGDPDDEQSLVRFLLYANEWDVEGIICNRPAARDGENRNRERTGLGIVRRMVEAYGECHPRLVRHDPRYPDAAQLLARTVAGYGEDEDGVRLVLSAVDADDPRPLWFLNWGTEHGSAPSSLKLALDRVLEERGQSGYAAFKDRLRLSSDDQFGDHTAGREPSFRLWIDTFRPELDRKRWYHRFSALTATAGGFDIERDARTGHGPLGALYPLNTTHPQKEGDSMTFLYLVPTGMNDPEQPAWGSWAGRYGRRETHPGQPYYWANQQDAWQGTTHRENTLARWAADLQNDFKARLDWCVTERDAANHPPVPDLQGAPHRTVAAGEQVTVDASGSRDPDGDNLAFAWSFYPEAGSYQGELPALSSTTSAATSFVAPRVTQAGTLHLLLTVTDAGTPPLARYQRLVIEVTP